MCRRVREDGDILITVIPPYLGDEYFRQCVTHNGQGMIAYTHLDMVDERITKVAAA